MIMKPSRTRAISAALAPREAAYLRPEAAIMDVPSGEHVERCAGQFGGQHRHDLRPVPDDPDVGGVEDRRARIGVHRHHKPALRVPTMWLNLPDAPSSR